MSSAGSSSYGTIQTAKGEILENTDTEVAAAQSTLSGEIAGVASDVAGVASGVSGVASDVADVASGVSGVASDVAGVASDVAGVAALLGELGPIPALRVSSEVFTSSGTFTAPKAGKYLVVASGGGGSGLIVGTTHSTGGCGGFIAVGVVTLADSEEVSVTIGAGGAGSLNGNDGGDTTFGTYVTAAGGEHGCSDSSAPFTTPKGGTSGGIFSSTPDVFVPAEGIRANFGGVLDVHTTGGACVYSSSSAFTGGGGAGIGGNGGDAAASGNAGNGEGAGAGGGSMLSVGGVAGSGGDGIVYVFWEA
jgi:hypothetical protein